MNGAANSFTSLSEQGGSLNSVLGDLSNGGDGDMGEVVQGLTNSVASLDQGLTNSVASLGEFNLNNLLNFKKIPPVDKVFGADFLDNRSLHKQQFNISGDVSDFTAEDFLPTNLGSLFSINGECPEQRVTMKVTQLIDIIKSIEVSGDYEDNYVAVTQANYDKVLTTITEFEELCPF